MNFVRATTLASLFLLAFTSSCVSNEIPDLQITVAGDLQQLGRESQDKQLPILLFFSADHCHFCEIVEEEFLKPMLRSGDYVDKILIRKVDADDFEQRLGFDGKPISDSGLANDKRVFVTPTVLFLDPQGNELVERMVGITTVDFYGGYLDDAIDKALLITRKGSIDP